MSESMPKNDSQLSAEMESLSVVDVLQPITPIRKYEDYDFYAEQEFDHPDYKFRINDINHLIETDSELIGKTFLLPGFDILTQIKCAVNFDSFKIYVIFLNPDLEDKAVKWRVNPMFKILIAQNADEKCAGTIFEDNFSFNKIIVYGKFYQLCALSFREHVENHPGFSGNSITLHLFVDKLFLTAPKDICLKNDVFRWKVDVSKLNLSEVINERRVVGLSPFFSSDPEGLKVQILLYIYDDRFRSEIRFLKEFEFKHKKCHVSLNVMHLTKEYGQSSPPRVTYYTDIWGNIQNFSDHINVCSRDAMPGLVFNNKLFVKVTLTYE